MRCGVADCCGVNPCCGDATGACYREVIGEEKGFLNKVSLFSSHYNLNKRIKFPKEHNRAL